MDKRLASALGRVTDFIERELPACTDAFESTGDLDVAVGALEEAVVDQERLCDTLRALAEGVLADLDNRDEEDDAPCR